MEGKFSFAIISDDVNLTYLDRSLHRPKWDKTVQEHVLKHLDYKLIGTSLYACQNYMGTPDVFIIDAGCITNHNVNDRHFDMLKRFASNHTSSLFCIVSLFKSRMEDCFAELRSYISEEVVVEMHGNGNEQVADYMYKKVLQYYPYGGK